MYEIISNFLSLAADFINNIFNWQVDWNGTNMQIGFIATAFIWLALELYYVLKAIGILSGTGDDE